MDYDQDGFGDPNSTISSRSQPSGYVANSDDCNDGLASISPDAVETCNAIDDNCNELVDDEPEEGILILQIMTTMASVHLSLRRWLAQSL